LVGPMMADMLRGGETIGQNTLSRFFLLHTAVLPISLVAIITLHIVLIRVQGVTPYVFPQDKGKKKKDFKFFPEHFMTEIVMGLTIMIILSALAMLAPAAMGPKGDPNVTPDHIKPEWFFYFTFRWLKLFSATAAILSLGFLVCVAFLWPFIDAAIRRKWKKSEVSIIVGILAALMIIGFTLWEALAAH
ncbi:MAG: cytochrome b N-terminal domain-containing protein, partial [Planctomycetes bacterium]|nr:cytochrome b N-terminal domain-containing protein [Planctomycetota bacterium]